MDILKPRLSKLMNNLSITRKLYLIIFILLASYTFLALYFINHEKKVWDNRIREKGVEVNELLAKICASPIQTFDYVSIIEHISDFKKGKDIIYVIVYKENDIVITKEEAKIKSSLPDLSQIKIISSDIIFYGQNIGKIETGISLEEMNLSIRKSLNQIILVFAIQSAIIFMLFLLMKGIIKPIKSFTKQIRGVSISSIKHKVRVDAKDEIGELADAFNMMIVQLEEHRDNLEKLVAERTLKLETANEELKNEATERKLAENARRESEERFRRFSIASSYGFAMGELTGQLIYANPATLQIVEEEREEDFTSKTFYQYYTPEDAERLRREILPVVMGTGQWVGEIPLLSVKGNMRPTEQNMFLIHDKHGNPRMVGNIITDITERKSAEEEQSKLQAQLQRAEKMEVIGTLAGGVAHDLNNVLSGLVSYPDLLLMNLPEDSPLREPILIMQNSGKKAAAIVQDLLTLARRGVAVNEVTNLNDVINEYLKSPEYKKLKSFYPNVQVEADLETDLLNVLASPVHLSKTVMNLVSNGAEALSGAGTINISTINQYIDRPIRGYDEVKEGDYIVLTVADDGMGIAATDLERIFEPFYTKKVMGRSGTGLGMAVVWGTVKDHNGYIDVESTEGKGTTFKLYFPVTRAEAKKEESASLEACMGNGERVLVVDDVKEQRQIAIMLLTKLGYSVNAVSSGKEAIEYVKTNSPDLLILDMIMDPGIDGLDTYKEILQLHPGQKAVIASGFSETKRVKKTQKLGAGQYVKKPYTLEKIGLAVKAELGN